MANNENLKSNSERTPIERKKLAQKAGKASGKARREKRDMKAELLLVMDEVITDKKTGKKVTPRKAISVTLLHKALSGDLKAIKLLLEIIGEMPKELPNDNNGASTEEAYIKWLEGLGNAD